MKCKVFKVDVLEARKMGKHEDRSRTVMARHLGQSFSKMAGLVCFSHYEVINTYQLWSKKEQLKLVT